VGVALRVDGIMVVAGLAVAALGVAWYHRKAITEAVDITSANNVINKAAESVYQSTTGSQQSIGADFYDWLNPQVEECFNTGTKQWEPCKK